MFLSAGMSLALAPRGNAFAMLMSDLFGAGEQGIAYDLSDFSSMYQDSAGTTPVTAVTQSVGLLLDKRLGLVRGAEVWNDANTSFVANSSKVSPGVYRLFSSTGAETADILCTGIFANNWYEVTFTIDSVAAAGGGVRVGAASAGAVVAATVGAKRCISLCDANANAFKRVSGITDLQISNVSFKALPGNHATQATAGSRPTLQVDGNGKYLLRPNGSSSFMVTGNIDASAFGFCTKWSAARKTSDAAAAILDEFSVSSTANSGTFATFAPPSASPAYTSRIFGTGVVNDKAASGYAAPITNVLCQQLDITSGSAGGQNVLRINGVATGVNGSATTPGVGFGNFPHYLFARGGTTLFFGGDWYGEILRFSTAASTAAQISSGEAYMAQMSGVTL